MSLLTVYKASAGSGKTFQLTAEYLKLIFNPEINFRNILAVTFTNKATAEMRERILSELYTLANSNESKHGEVLKKEFHLSNEELSMRATYLLRLIVHNYSRFNISTIDSFFQTILKAFTREIGLNATINIEINHTQVIEASIDDFFSRIDEKPQLKNWLTTFAKQKIQEGKSWDVQKDTLTFAKDAFNESFFSLSEEELTRLTSLDSFQEFKTKLKAIIDPFVKTLREYGSNAMMQISKCGLSVDDFHYKASGVAGYLSKLQQASASDIPEPKVRVIKAYNSTDGIEDWCAKKAPNVKAIQQCVQSGLQEILIQSVDFYHNHSLNFHSAFEVYKNLDVFALVVEVFNHLRSYCNEQDIFLLSMASPFLAKLIDDNDAPFIYEKTGEYLKYYMIDEFQDTSKMQWQNFYPLFLNSISQGNRSLVVGDVKQSIYRWRNSDWNLLHSKLVEDFAMFNPEVKNLPNNYRSSKNIVAFNNWCFTSIAAQAQEMFSQKLNEGNIELENPAIIQQIYETVKQELPKNSMETTGYISIQFNPTKSEDEPIDALILKQLIDTLYQLFENGYQPKDIAILVRRNYEGSKVAKWLMEHRQANPENEHLFAFVSSDSVFLKSSVLINYLIAAMHYLNEPQNELYKAQFIYYYFSDTNSASHSAFKLADIDFSNNQVVEQYLPADFVNAINELKQLPLIQMVNRLLTILVYPSAIIEKTRSLAFIQTFQDVILNFTQKQGNNLSSFLEWWDQPDNKTAVSLSDEQNAIRIITIHKSKGLEYKAVILPFVDWNLDQKSKIIWSGSSVEPFNYFPSIPITYSSKLLQTVFSAQYMHEYLLAVVDNLNMLYVAFTRAANALFIIAPQPGNSGQEKKINGLLYRAVSSDSIGALNGGDWNNETNLFTFGSIPKLAIADIDTKLAEQSIPIFNQQDFLKLRLQSKDYFNLDEESSNELFSKGQIFHSLLERIVTIQDINVAIDSMVGSGLLESSEIGFYQTKLNNLLLDQKIAGFFSSRYKTITETSFLMPDGSIKRPDRVLFSDDEIVVIDYKYTQKQSQEHLNQVLGYMKAIEAIEKTPTTGYVWYLIDNNLVEVKK